MVCLNIEDGFFHCAYAANDLRLPRHPSVYTTKETKGHWEKIILKSKTFMVSKDRSRQH